MEVDFVRMIDLMLVRTVVKTCRRSHNVFLFRGTALSRVIGIKHGRHNCYVFALCSRLVRLDSFFVLFMIISCLCFCHNYSNIMITPFPVVPGFANLVTPSLVLACILRGSCILKYLV